MYPLTSCSENSKPHEQEIESLAEVELAEVDTVTLRSAAFSLDVVSNGKARARRVADVYFRSAELISDVPVHNGMRVPAGAVLARLDMYKLESEKTRNESARDKAVLELQDILIGQGYDPTALSEVPAEIMRLARIRSGLQEAEANLANTVRDIEHATLTAPFAGVVANVKKSKHAMASTTEPLCRVIDDSVMDVEFAVLESEAAALEIGDRVVVSPFNSSGTIPGVVTEINPMVDENGQVAVKAAIENCRGLTDGMNVRVLIRRNLESCLSVPKSAVVLRSGRQVVFTYNAGKAFWNYVTTGRENFDSYEITTGLDDGATVIVSGCENLAHETPVKISR